MLITSVLQILDQRGYEGRVSQPVRSDDFRLSLPKPEEAKPVGPESRAGHAIEASGLGRPALPEEPIFTTLPSQKAVEEFLRAMEEARTAKRKIRSIEIFE